MSRLTHGRLTGRYEELLENTLEAIKQHVIDSNPKDGLDLSEAGAVIVAYDKMILLRVRLKGGIVEIYLQEMDQWTDFDYQWDGVKILTILDALALLELLEDGIAQAEETD